MNAGVDLASRPDADVNRSRRGGAHRAPPQPRKRLPPAHRREESGTLRTAVGSRFGGLPRTFWIVFVGMIANRIGTMVIPFMVFYLGSRGISITDTGAIIVALGIGGMVGPPLGGLLADRFGPRLAVIVGLVVTPFSFGALLAAPTPFMLGVAATLLGVTGSVYKPAASAMVGEVVGPQSRLKAFSLLHWGFNIGTAVAAGAAGFLAERGYWLLFLIDGITCLVYALIVLVGIPNDRRQRAAAVKTESGVGYGVVFRDRLMVAYLVLSALGITVYTQTEFTVPLSIRLDGLPPSAFGMLAVLNAVLVVALQPLLYGWLSRRDRVRVLAASWLLISVGVASTGLADQVWQYAVTAAIWSVGEVVNGVVAGSFVADLAPPGAQGRYQGAFAWVWAVARLAAPASATGVFATVGPGALWWGCALVGLMTALGTLLMGPAMRRRIHPPGNTIDAASTTDTANTSYAGDSAETATTDEAEKHDDRSRVRPVQPASSSDRQSAPRRHARRGAPSVAEQLDRLVPTPAPVHRKERDPAIRQ